MWMSVASESLHFLEILRLFPIVRKKEAEEEEGMLLNLGRFKKPFKEIKQK